MFRKINLKVRMQKSSFLLNLLIVNSLKVPGRTDGTERLINKSTGIKNKTKILTLNHSWHKEISNKHI